MGVLPWAASSDAFATRPSKAIPESSINAWFPNRTVCPFTWATIPLPGIAWNSDTAANSSPRFWASLTIASPNGCSEPRSADAANSKSSCSELPSAAEATRSVTTGFPVVRVPVLSKTTVSTLWAISRACACLISTPISAPLPVPTMIAVGVASPSAHGQAIISTETKTNVENVKAGAGPSSIQNRKAAPAAIMTAGTKYAATWSANR